MLYLTGYIRQFTHIVPVILARGSHGLFFDAG